jgi:hypothetical protein
MRSAASIATWESSWGGDKGAATREDAVLITPVISTKLFHWLQSGQRPSHLRLSRPHSLQMNTVFAAGLSGLLTG